MSTLTWIFLLAPPVLMLQAIFDILVGSPTLSDCWTKESRERWIKRCRTSEDEDY